MMEVIDNGSSATLQSLTYAYSPTNNVQTMTNAVASSQTIGSATTSYGYGTGSDLLATLSMGGMVTQAISYTADGRIASLNPGTQAPGANTLRRSATTRTLNSPPSTLEAEHWQATPTTASDSA